MQKPQIVAHFLVPADQHAPEAMHPTMGAFHDPPPCLETELLLERLGFLAPGPDVGGEPALGEQVADLVKAIAFIEAPPLGPGWGWLRPCNRELVRVARAILTSWRLAPSTARPIGTPPPSVSMLRLVPSVPRSVGRLPACFPPKGGFGHRAIHGQPVPVNALQGRIHSQALCPAGQENPGCRPLLEAAVRRATGPEARVLQGIPLAPGAKDEEDGIHGPAIIDARPVAPEWMRLPGREQRLDALPPFVGYPPITPDVLWLVTHGSGSSGKEVFPTGYPKYSLMG
jgi:hypothetical protein